MAVVELVGVRKRHRRSGPWVLDGVSLTVAGGRVAQIVGTNGCGKSTLLRIAAGLDRATDGSVQIGGASTYVPEQTPVPPAMVVRGYLRHQARLQRGPAGSLDDMVDHAIDDHRLGPVADRPLRELSKGWGQRVVIAQALLASPAVTFLDEPFTGVDAASRDHLLQVIERAADRGTAVVLTSHEAMAIHGLERVRLRDGRIADDDGERRVERAVRLRPRDADREWDEHLARHPAVRRIEQDGGTVSVLIDGDESGDGFLRAVLDAGWTIERLDTRGAS